MYLLPPFTSGKYWPGFAPRHAEEGAKNESKVKIEMERRELIQMLKLREEGN